MITPGFYPLVAGLVVTSALVGWSDLKGGWVYLWEWWPAFLGVGYFYWASQDVALIAVALVTSASMVSATWATLKFVHQKKEQSAMVGRADYLAVAVFGFWPLMAAWTITLALLVGIVGAGVTVRNRRLVPQLWNRGQRAIPLAGLMGVLCLVYIAELAA